LDGVVGGVGDDGSGVEAELDSPESPEFVGGAIIAPVGETEEVAGLGGGGGHGWVSTASEAGVTKRGTREEHTFQTSVAEWVFI
jgi:hypothetical protein